MDKKTLMANLEKPRDAKGKGGSITTVSYDPDTDTGTITTVGVMAGMVQSNNNADNGSCHFDADAVGRLKITGNWVYRGING